jgi:hypothetical protein
MIQHVDPTLTTYSAALDDLTIIFYGFLSLYRAVITTFYSHVASSFVGSNTVVFLEQLIMLSLEFAQGFVASALQAVRNVLAEFGF